MTFAAVLLLWPAVALAFHLQGSPALSNVLIAKVKPMGSGAVQNVPDGKFLSFRADPNDKSKGYIINTTPNWFMTSSSSYIEDVTAPRDLSGVSTAGALPSDGSGFVRLPASIPIPDASETGMRGNGTLYDQLSVWIFGAFRLSETSQPGADPNAMVGFEHNEDYWGDSKCTYKSIGVRYSSDLGKSWTRSVPIVTSGVQTAQCDMSQQFTGGGDFAPAWNHQKKEWNIFGPDTSLAMKVSKDPMASPGSWTRVEPVSGQTGPGFKGPTDGSLAHGDLKSIAGSSPSILWDQSNSLYHMVWGKWGGGIAYANSTDLYRWTEPMLIVDSDQQPGSCYPTLLGSEGDTLTTDGTARLYFGATNQVSFGRALWTVGIDFGGGNSTSSLLGSTPSNSSAASSSPGSGTNSGSGSDLITGDSIGSGSGLGSNSGAYSSSNTTRVASNSPSAAADTAALAPTSSSKSHPHNGPGGHKTHNHHAQNHQKDEEGDDDDTCSNEL